MRISVITCTVNSTTRLAVCGHGSPSGVTAFSRNPSVSRHVALAPLNTAFVSNILGSASLRNFMAKARRACVRRMCMYVPYFANRAGPSAILNEYRVWCKICSR